MESLPDLCSSLLTSDWGQWLKATLGATTTTYPNSKQTVSDWVSLWVISEPDFDIKEEQKSKKHKFSGSATSMSIVSPAML